MNNLIFLFCIGFAAVVMAQLPSSVAPLSGSSGAPGRHGHHGKHGGGHSHEHDGNSTHGFHQHGNWTGPTRAPGEGRSRPVRAAGEEHKGGFSGGPGGFSGRPDFQRFTGSFPPGGFSGRPAHTGSGRPDGKEWGHHRSTTPAGK